MSGRDWEQGGQGGGIAGGREGVGTDVDLDDDDDDLV
jgi:hypothetical protein